MSTPEQIREGMHDSWFPYGESTSPKTRTPDQAAFDKGVCAAAEFARRMMNCDESIAWLIMRMCTTYRRELENNTNKEQP